MLRFWLVVASLCLTACAQPFVATEGPSAPSGQLLRSDREIAQENYLNCVYGYAIPRWNYDATVYELADASIGACKKEISELRVVLVRTMNFSYESADRVVRGIESDTRGALIAALIDARNTKQPMKAPKLTGT